MAEGMTSRGAMAVVVAAVVAGWLVPGHPPGVGVLLAGLSVAAGVLVARATRPSDWQLTAGAAAVLLGSTVALSDAEWVVALASLGALGLGTLAVTEVSTWTELVVAPPVVALHGLRAPAVVTRPLASAVGAQAAGGRLVPVLRAGALTAGVLLVFGGLFASADSAFAQLLEDHLLPDLNLSLWPARAAVLVGALLVAGALSTAPSLAGSRTSTARRRLGRGEWASVLVALDVLVAAFVTVQLTVLFGGHEHVLDTTGLTYAEYARSGFFQLLVASALTLGVVAAAVHWAAPDRPGDRRLLQVLLGILCVLTLVVLASALRRLGLYEEAFGFTRARLFAHAIVWWLGASFVLVLAAGALWRGAWLARGAVLLTAVVAISFAWVQPDRVVAQRNVERFERTGELDVSYLAGLSADAVPALVELPPGTRDCVLQPQRDDLLRPDPWAAANWSRARARRLLAQVEPVACNP